MSSSLECNLWIAPHGERGEWVVDDRLIREFADLYGRLKSVGDTPLEPLQYVLDRIFVELIEQAESDLERVFLRELFDDLRLLLRGHVDFYSAREGGVVPPLGRRTQLREDGFFITNISNECLGDIRRSVAPMLGVLRMNASSCKFDRVDLSVNSGRVIRRVVRLLNREFAANGVLNDVEGLLRRRARVIGVALELSVPGSSWWKLPTEPGKWPKTLYAHVDRGIDAPKAIVYLTDVGPLNGPTSCYPGAYQQVNKNPLQDLIGRSLETIGSDPESPLHAYYELSSHPLQNDRFRSHFMRLPVNLRFNSHFGWDVIPQSRLEEFLVDSEVQILGPAGTSFVFDGAELLHRGGLIEEGERVVLQVVFGESTLRDRVARVLRFAIRKLRRG